jgi:superfamily II DNA or RNA helicase
MVRVAYRISPLPNDADQFQQFARAVESCLKLDTREEQQQFVRSTVLNSKGGTYAKSMISGILNNLSALNLIQSHEDGPYRLTTYGFDLCGADCATTWLSENFLDVLHADGFNSMHKKSADSLQPAHPFLVTLLLDVLDSLRGSNQCKTVSEIRESLIASGEEGSEIHGYVDKNQIELKANPTAADKATAIRPYAEACKLLSLTCAIRKDGSRWTLNPNESLVDSVRKKLRDRSFDHYLADVVSALGPNNPIFEDVGPRFIPSACRYIAYRYSGAVNRSHGLATQAMKDLEPIRKHVLEGYRANKPGAQKARPSFRSLLTDDRNLRRMQLTEKYPSKKHTISRLGLDIITRVESLESGEAERYLSRIESEDNLRSTELDGLKHGQGAYSWNPEIQLHKWQNNALQAWIDSGMWGVVSAVTGTGKTIFAIAAAKRFLDEHKDGKVTVIVPSIVLLHQWLREFAKCLDLSLAQVGLRGGGYTDEYTSERRVMIWVVNSAIKNDALAELVSDSPEHMLVLDECHEYGGESYKQVMDVHHIAALAISATPAKGENGRLHPVEAKYGDPIFRVGYKRAHEEGLISDFQVRYVRLDLTHFERQEYDNLSEQLRKVRRDLIEQYPQLYDEINLHAAVQKLLSSGEGSGLAAKFMKLTSDRVWVVKNAVSRDEMMANLLPTVRDDSTTSIIFTERIAEIDDMISYRQKHGSRASLSGAEPIRKEAVLEITGLLNDTGVMNYGVYHSKFPTPWKKWMVDWFRNGILRTMFSVRALAQGFDLPGAEVGIIRSSSPNVRLRIQTIGRMIRRANVDKTAIIWIAYVAGTSEERIFSSHNWSEEFPDVDNIQQHYRLRRPGEETDGEEHGLVLIGGEDTLPQFDRDLTEDEINAIDEAELVAGEPHPEQRLHRHSAYTARLHEGDVLLVLDSVERKMAHAELESAGKVLLSMSGGPTMHIAVNGQVIAWHKSAWVYLGSVNLGEFESAVEKAEASIYDADDFFSDWNL